MILTSKVSAITMQILGYEANIGLIYNGPKWLWVEMTRNHQHIWHNLTSWNFRFMLPLTSELSHEKTCLQSCRPHPKQARLYSH